MPSDLFSNPALLVCVAAVVVLLLAVRGRRRPSAGASYHCKAVLSPWERSAIGMLGLQLRPGLHLCPQVRLAELLEVRAADAARRQGARNRIDRKSVDFVVVDVASGQPVLVIELDDRTHDRQDRRHRDAFVNDVLRTAGIPVVHFRPSQRQLDIRPHLAEALISFEAKSMPAAAE